MRIAIIGGPRSGKSTLAAQLSRKHGYSHFCADPKSLVKEPLPNVTYLPEGLKWGQDSEFVCAEWFKNTNCIIEGVGVVRALRKWGEFYQGNPVDQIVVMPDAVVERNFGQEQMAKAVSTIWKEIEMKYKGITVIL